MKKILAAFDGLKFNESTALYAVNLSRAAGAHLVGVFLEDFMYHGYSIQDIATAGDTIAQTIRTYQEKDQQKRNQSLHRFEQLCSGSSTNFSVHHDRNIAIQELLHETVYADLLVIGARETFTHYDEILPTGFIKDVLTDARCPVLVVPDKFEEPRHIVFLYDGTPASVYAIKMFSYILGPLKTAQIEVLSIKPLKDSVHLPDNHLFKEFMKRHFPDTTYTVIRGNAELDIQQQLTNKGSDTMIVLGAYQRNAISRWLKTSMADILMRNMHAPLFIAHY